MRRLISLGGIAVVIVYLSLMAFTPICHAQCTTEFDSATQSATSYGDVLIFEASSASTPESLTILLGYELGGPSSPGIYRIEDDPVNANFATCHTCLLIWDYTGPTERIFLGTSGELDIQSIGPAGSRFTGMLINVTFNGVTIDWDTGVSTPVPGGETRCIQTFSFDTLITGDTTMDSDGDGLSDSDEIDIFGTDPQNPDTDGGGVGDGQEVLVDGTNPLDPADDLLPIDADGDGYPLGQDCNDNDPAINPGAQEIWYDGIDQNCDGYNDFDQDFDGSPMDEDCDDTNPLMNPGSATDFCDGFDNDCDDQIDEDRQGSCIALQLTWHTPTDPDETDNDGTDLDLHLLHPNGDWFESPWDCSFQNRNPNWGDPTSSLDDPSLDIDDTNGVGPEVISLEVPESGAVYKVGAHYYSDHGYGPSYASVRVFINGVRTFEEADKLLSVREFWEVAAIDWDAQTVTPIGNINPGAVDDTASTVVNAPVSIDVLSNDSSPEGNPLFVHSFDAVSSSGGTVSCDTAITTPEPQCTYTPPLGFSGADWFSYDATDGSNISFRALVTIDVNLLPGQCLQLSSDILHFGSVEVGGSSTHEIFFDNCGSVPVTVQSIEITDDAASAYSIIWIPPLPVTYNPSEHDAVVIAYEPPDATTHTATLRIQTDIGTFNVSLSGTGTPAVNEPPNPFGDVFATTANTPVSIDVLANDHDADFDTLYINSFDSVSANGGSVSCDTTISTPVPQCTYTPPSGFTGTDSFTYDITDGDLVSPGVALVTIDVYINHPAEWAALYNGTGNNSDGASAIAVDEMGNVYVTGYSSSEGSGIDFVTISYDLNGNERWIARHNGPANQDDYARAVAVGPTGIVYVAGDSESETGYDIALVAYDMDGNELWTANYNGPAGGNDYLTAGTGSSGIAVDSSGNVMLTGMSWGESTGFDYVTLSYDFESNQRWVARYNGTRNENDGASSIAVDEDGNVYVTGLSNYPDPSTIIPGFYSDPKHGDYATVAYDSLGNQLWAAIYDGNCGEGCDCGDNARSVSVSPTGVIYVTGTSRGEVPPAGCEYLGSIDLATVAYDRQGNEVWVSRYTARPDVMSAQDMAVDESGSVYVTGYVVSPPFAGIGTTDFLTVAYDSAGNERWVARSGFTKFDESPSATAVDRFGNIYVTGNIDFDNSGLNWDIFTVAYDSEGNERWIGIIDGPSKLLDSAYDLAVDHWGNIYIAGMSGWSIDDLGPNWSQSDYITIKYAAEDGDGDGIPDMIDSCPNENASGFDADNDGCIDSVSGLGEVVSTLVAEGVILPELENSLLSKIGNAEKSATKENICAALNQLQALKNEIDAQRGKKISDGAANLMITYADNVIASLVNQLPPGESC